MLVPDEQAAQMWWLVTARLSGAGIATMVFKSSFFLKALGMVFLVMPHLWRAPPLMTGETQGACKFSYGVQCFVNYPERCLLDSDRPPVGSRIRATGK